MERAPLGPGSGQRDLLLASLDETEPTEEAPVALVDAYLAAAARLGSGSSGVVVLVTSGETDLDQGCTETTDAMPHLTADLTSAVQAAGEAGISTLVVGSPGSETAARGRSATAYLSELASVARAVPCNPLREFESKHFDMNAEAPIAPLLNQALRSRQACLLLELLVSPNGSDLPLGAELHLLIHSDVGVLYLDKQPASACDAGFKIENDQVVACPAAAELIACLPGATPMLVTSCGYSGEVP